MRIVGEGSDGDVGDVVDVEERVGSGGLGHGHDPGPDRVGEDLAEVLAKNPQRRIVQSAPDSINKRSARSAPSSPLAGEQDVTANTAVKGDVDEGSDVCRARSGK